MRDEHGPALGKAERDKAQWKLDEKATELDEAQQRETATAEVLQVINGSPGDLSQLAGERM